METNPPLPDCTPLAVIERLDPFIVKLVLEDLKLPPL